MEIIAALEDTFGGRFPEEVLPEMKPAARWSTRWKSILGKTPRKRPATPTDEIPPRNYHFDQFPEYLALKQQWRTRRASTGVMNPYFNVHERRDQRHDARSTAAS